MQELVFGSPIQLLHPCESLREVSQGLEALALLGAQEDDFYEGRKGTCMVVRAFI